jgi:hypothetical protein
MTILPPKKLPYRDAFNPRPAPWSMLYPCRITNPPKLTIVNHKVVKRRRLPVPRIFVLLSMRLIKP